MRSALFYFYYCCAGGVGLLGSSCSCQFDSLLTCHGVDINAHYCHSLDKAAYLGCGVDAGAVFLAQQAERSDLILGIVEKSGVSEDYDAPEIGGEFLRHHVILIHDTERAFGIAADGVDLMSGRGGVDVDGFSVVDKVDWHGVGVVIIAGDGPDGIFAGVQNFFCLLGGEELLEASHFSLFHHASTLRPIIDKIRVVIKKMRQNVAGS